MARESLDEVEQMVVDDYRARNMGNEEVRTFSDREILQMSPPTIHDYKVYYDRRLAPLEAELEREKEDLAENSEQAARSDLTYYQREEFQREVQANRFAIDELEKKIELIVEEKEKRVARFGEQEPPQR